MLVGIGNGVNTPQGVIASRVWLLGKNKVPLIGSEFLFYSVMSSVWKNLWLSVDPHTTEGESHAGWPPAVFDNKIGNHLIQGRTQMANSFDNLEADIIRERGLDLREVLNSISIRLSNDGNAGLKVPIDFRHEVLEFALSSFDLFV